MNARERLANSLSAKTFNAVLLFAVVISIAAVAFGFFLYMDSVIREYRTKTQYLSRTAAMFIDMDSVMREAEIVADVYDSEIPDKNTSSRDPAYLEKYAAVSTDSEFESIRHFLDDLRVENGAIAAYVAMLDYDTDRMIFVVDGDQKDTFCPPGSWDELDDRYVRGFRDGMTGSFLDSLYGTPPMRSVVNRMEKYGYRCSAGTLLFEIGKYPVMVFFDTDMTQVVSICRSFLLQYLCLMAMVTIAVVLLLVRRLKKKVVDPINELSDAAAAYSESKRNQTGNHNSFSRLNIRTGDEIENLSLIMKDMESDIAAFEENLTHVTAEKEKINLELNVARQIQEGILPHIFPPFPDRREIDIYASMRAAKMVGGDFYDFFRIDEDHLAVVIADVSGKGIPAALFMMASKILIENVAKMEKSSPAKILSAVNSQISENNIAEMFLTVWLGILDISTGTLKTANAGHEYPAVRHTDGSFQIYKEKHSFIVGGLKDTVYKEYEITLAPGDVVFQYTDGVTEAENAENELFGTDRLLSVLNSDEETDPKLILEKVISAIDNFAGDTPQFDDITMLCLRFNGKEAAERDKDSMFWEGEASREKMQDFLSFVETNLESAECPPKTIMKVVLAAEEIFVNIASYAYPSGTGKARVSMSIPPEGEEVKITFMDDGIPFDPFLREDPDTTLSAEERNIGGLGIYMVKKTMDDVSYEYRDGHNVLTIRKKF